MARIPTAADISGPASFRPTGPAPVADYSAIGRGVSNLGNAVTQIARQEQEKQNVIDFAAADAFATKQYLDMQNQFEQDGDYATFADRAERGSQDIANKAAELIRSPRARQQWIAANETTRLRQVDAIGDRGRQMANEAERVQFLSSLDDYSQLISEPTTPDDVLARTRQSLTGTIDVAQAQGLLTPAEAAKAKEDYLTRAEQQRALNLIDAESRVDPEGVLGGLGITQTGDPLSDARNTVTLPIVAAPGVNVADVDPAVLSRYEQVQSAFGVQLPVISGVRTGEHNDAVGGASNSRHEEENGGDAIDIDVSQLSKPERVRLIETASAMGFTGIGVYANSLHLDTGNKRAWGPSYHSDSVPAWAKDAIDRHTSGQIAEVPVAAGRDVDPRFAALSYEQRAAAYDRTKQVIEQRGMEMRVGIETTVENAPIAIARQGEYSGDMPTANDFVQAYGAAQGMERYEAFDASVKVAQDTYAMRTMTADEISSLLEQATPTATGDDAMAQEKRYTQLAQAAEATIKAREEDPAGYVMEVYPAVSNAWNAVQESDSPQAFSQAVAVTAMAQEQIGIQNLSLLPKPMADNAVAMFNNTTLPDEQRMGALTGLIMEGTQNPEHQVAIYNQLIAAGVPETVQPAMEALGRGDSGAAMRLFRAVMAPVDKLDAAIPKDTVSQIPQRIQEEVFDTNGIGEIYYDLTYGSVGNQNEASRDLAVITNSVKLRLIDGSAGGNLQTAIDMTMKDMFGDVQVVTGSASGGRAGLKLLLPKDADRNAYQSGFDALMGEVGAAIASDMQMDMGDVPTEGAQRAIAEAQVANYVEQTLASGYFTGAGDGLFKFIDPNGRGAVVGADGQPLIFTEQEVLAAGAEAGQLQSSMLLQISPASMAGAQFGASAKPPQDTGDALHPFDPAINTPRPNPDGSVSTELTRTVQFSDGSWGNVPSLWWGDGSNVSDMDSMDDDQLAEYAAEYERRTGRKFPRFATLNEAETAAQGRSQGGGGEQGSIDQ